MSLYTRCLWIFIIFLFLVCACATGNQHLSLNPDVRLDSSGEFDSTVYISVRDDRINPATGQTEATDRIGDFTTDRSIPFVFMETIRRELDRKGFRTLPQTGKDSSPTLTVNIRQLDYNYATAGVLTGGVVNSRAVVNASGKHGTSSYNNTYTVENETRVIVKPSLEKNEALVNQLISDVLSQLLKDVKLTAFLSTENHN